MGDTHIKKFQLGEPNQKRWRRFKRNRRGFISFWIFLTLFIVTLFAPILANDKPILIHYKNAWYFPVLFSYPETTFDGDFETETDYRDPHVAQLIAKQGWLLWPPIKFDGGTIAYNLPSPPPTSPSSENWLGTDDQGRDVLARVIYGFRISVLFGVLLTATNMLLSVISGAIQGYFGGLIDLLGQRFIEIWNGLPALFILIILSNVVVPNILWLFFALLLFTWTNLVAVVRAEFLKARNLDYVRAARALGATNFQIMKKHMLPNAMIALLTYSPFQLCSAITTLTALDFLGLGLPPGSSSLGELLSQGKNNLTAPWLGLTGFLAVAGTLTLLIFIGEAIRDAFDPRQK